MQLNMSRQTEGGGDSLREGSILRSACIETSPMNSSVSANAAVSAAFTDGAPAVQVKVVNGPANLSHRTPGVTSHPAADSSIEPATSPYAARSSGPEAPPPEESPQTPSLVELPSIQVTCDKGCLEDSNGLCDISTCSGLAQAVPTWTAQSCLLKALDNHTEVLSPIVLAFEKSHYSCGTGTPLGISESSSSCPDDLEKVKPLSSSNGEMRDDKRFFDTPPQSGEFVPLIEWLLHRGKCGDIDAPAVSQRADGEYTQASFFNEDYIMKLCAAATEVLVKEPTLLELEVLAHDTLVVVGDIHGQFQDLYTSVLCQQYDRRRCNTDGRDRRFLFMGDYVDRGPHSLEVVLLLLALKVEYPTLVYLTRGNHEEEKTSRVYGFLTEATASLGAAAGAAVWTAVNRVFLDLPLAAVVHTLHMRFFVAHGGLSPGLEKVDEIGGIDRHAYSTDELSRELRDIVDGLLWSDPCNGAGLFATSSRGCGWDFGPAASNAFCTSNNFDFICRAHQVAMDGYFWTHNDRVVTVFSAPNYCGIDDNRGAVMVVSGEAKRPSFEQYEGYDESDYSCPDIRFPYASYFY
ncbi:hypothetical protein LSCM1_05972 [Leishmania martiniquensis]|uniref:Serine/threonine specific protein phosphatases domain-containing protein n=1 Tax=Leishmania martiniquensis TaxID=1580590 RepID=A0A836KSL6_9TRYP|nr:hypothetical protein LSCM1_05972 [Leishmania martiniquensis]